MFTYISVCIVKASADAIISVNASFFHGIVYCRKQRHIALLEQFTSNINVHAVFIF